MLRDPFLDERFEPDLMWFVGVFNVYDREEILGAKLEVYDPNKWSDQIELIRKYSLNLGCLTYRHKLVLLESLADKLNDNSYDFQGFFDTDEDEAASWPRGEWYELENPRGFLEHVYKLALEVWKDELVKAASEDRSTW